MVDSERFWDKLAKRYAAKPIGDLAAYERKLDLIRAVLKPDMLMLEIGCGTGTTAITLAPLVKRIDAVDVSSEMLAIARQKARDTRVVNVDFRHSSIEALDIQAGTYDAIMAHSILHLVDDTPDVITNIYRWLKPGGVFVSSTVCVSELNLFIRLLLPVMRWLGLAPKLNSFGSEALRTMMTDQGFVLDHIWPIKHGVFLIAKKPVQQ